MNLDRYKNKNVHVVAVTGSEGSGILRFLVHHGFKKIITHDLLLEGSLEKSYRVWHKGISGDKKNKLFSTFKKDLHLTRFNSGTKYLADIENASLIFVPQSWRLYPKYNRLLFKLCPKIPFYNLTKLYLENTEAKTIGVTGTVGKGSVANLLYQLLKRIGKKAYFAGNDSWMIQMTDKITKLKKSDYLVLELSHRQLLDGVNKSPDYLVYTNLYPNHLDEVSWQEYQKTKLSLMREQNENQIAVLNYDEKRLRNLAGKIKSKTVYYSEENIRMNTKNIQKIYYKLLNNKSVHYFTNILAAYTVLDILHIPLENAVEFPKKINNLPARLELIFKNKIFRIYNDLKSTTPWAGIRGIRHLGKQTILICGGDTKGINFKNFFIFLKHNVKYSVFLRSQLAGKIGLNVNPDKYVIADSLEEALNIALRRSGKGDKILISPCAARFYSEFIKGKKSIKKIITSLLPKEQAE